jgi:hypothetical protein
MRGISIHSLSRNRRMAGMIAIAGLLAISACLPISANPQGAAMPPGTSSGTPGDAPKSNSGQSTAPSTTAGSAPASGDASTVPVEQIIQKFAAREAEFRIERDNFTYTQTFSIQTLDSSDRPDGEYQMTSEIVFTPDGKRFERVTHAPPPTLERIQLSQQDLDDLEHVQPFVLTTAELPKYNVKYVAHQNLDELSTYVFDVGPKTLEKNQRYFQGRIWVDDKDFAIVKTDGKAVPDIKKKGQENVFPRFETFRENIEGNYWFPTYTRSNDVLHFSSGDVHIRMAVHYEDYKRFGVTIKIGQPAKAQPDKTQPDK